MTTQENSASPLDITLERMELNDAELAALIRASSRDQCVQCTFGRGWVALLRVESNRWAHEFVAQMRANV